MSWPYTSMLAAKDREGGGIESGGLRAKCVRWLMVAIVTCKIMSHGRQVPIVRQYLKAIRTKSDQSQPEP
jgi:hypothetical protein